MLPSSIIATLPADSGENKAHWLDMADHITCHTPWLLSLARSWEHQFVRGHFKESAHPKLIQNRLWWIALIQMIVKKFHVGMEYQPRDNYGETKIQKGWCNRPHGAWLDLISEQTVPLRPVTFLWAPLVLPRERDRERAILVKTKLDFTQPFFPLFDHRLRLYLDKLVEKKEANGLLRACALFIFSLKWVINIGR